jgi:ferritin
MAKPEVIQALNDQIREELNSAYIYLALSADMEAQNLSGAAAWFRKQSSEEQEHAMKLYEYINDLGGLVVLQALPQPASGTKTLKDAFTKSLNHEKHISSCIHNLVRLARKHDDIPTETFLTWFVNEQVEEEKTAADILAKIEMTGSSTGSQFLIDRDLGKMAKSSD